MWEHFRWVLVAVRFLHGVSPHLEWSSLCLSCRISGLALSLRFRGPAHAHIHPVPPVDGASPGCRPWPALPLPGVASFPPSTWLFPCTRISLLFQGRLFHCCDCVSPSRELRLPSQLELDLLVNIPLVIVCLSLIIPCYWDRVCFCWLSCLNCYNFWYTMIGSAKYLLSRIAYLRLEIKCKNLFFTTILNCIENSLIFCSH